VPTLSFSVYLFYNAHLILILALDVERRQDQGISEVRKKSGFNQVDNEPETAKKMAVLSAGGCWLPRGLTFGPTNGPEDFQELVFTVFSRCLFREWFLFVDDLSVATGRPKCHGDGPSGAHDVSCVVEDRAATEGELGQKCLNVTSGKAYRSPFAHFLQTLLQTIVLSSIVRVAETGSISERLAQEKSATSPTMERTYPPGLAYTLVDPGLGIKITFNQAEW